MSQSNYPLRINVGFLIYQPVGTYREFGFDLEKLEIDPDFSVNKFKGVAHIDRVSKGLLVQGDFQGEIEAECVRCLTDCMQPVSISFKEIYLFPKQDIYSVKTGDNEDELIIPDNGYIDLAFMVREYFILETPIKSLCQPDCKGLCSVCGANLNEKDCGHQELAEKEL